MRASPKAFSFSCKYMCAQWWPYSSLFVAPKSVTIIPTAAYPHSDTIVYNGCEA